ncbi:MAG: basic amino acid/polyamine antiporter, family [Solirubrobacterales bacterium]|jgi:APA family basic amino acid/polyamine antiporter|nr:basic amino acid/polyamine antiporter, family [Solirubrobacterales bacterium]
MAERIPRESSLRRVHGVGALFAAAYGNVGSSIYYALGVVAGYALGLTPLTFMISGLIFAATAATYIEATVMYPEAGGSSSFARHAFNELVSFIAGWGQMLNYIITAAISSFAVLHYLAVFWSPLGQAPWDVVGSITVIALLAALNVKGTQESAKLNLVLAIGDLMTQVVLVGIGIALVLSPHTLINNIHLGVAPSWGNFALGIAVGMVAYTGIETISNMAEEARDAERTVVRSTQLVVVAVIGLYALLPIVALSAMPVVHDSAGHFTTALGSRFANDPVLGIVENLGLSHGLTMVLRYYVGVLAAVILLIATNAGLIGLSRLTYSMGHHRQLPERLRQIHPKFGTPYVAIIVFSIVAAITILPGQLAFLATMYSFGAMLSFTIAHISVVRLRSRRPERPRAWKPPMNFRFRGVEYPATAIFGGLGTFGAWIIVMVLDVKTLVAGAAWMAVGIGAYAYYRRSQGLPLTQTVKVATLEPVGVEEVEYRSILVPLEPDEFSEEAIATAASLAARKRGAIHVLALVPVPTELPLDSPMAAQESAAQSQIERAKLICGARVTGRVERVRPGQATKRIVEVADAIDAAAIVMPLSYRDGKPVWGKTIQGVLAKRPTRVLVVGQPSGQQGHPVPV